ncbi:uncharacterized protein LOC111389632 [Olea europaea var. sylvestris]|uniref:uncharacterized protein LOC111389632 n=1 Tax=Olea europaea var. sylvestris TaxID=158386 RepID=UPI000C1CE4C3|nr:uncharacterized protein LOC111389632 [Olea europaea var. sylvestris]
MSTIQSLVLVLYLLFTPFHGCRARNFGVFNKEPVEGYHLSSKDTEAQSLVRVSIQPDAKASEATKTERKNHDDNKMIPAKPFEAPSRKSLRKVEVSGAVQTEPAVSVSWRLTHKKQGEEEPVHNLDYLPPHTHPSHNN